MKENKFGKIGGTGVAIMFLMAGMMAGMPAVSAGSGEATDPSGDVRDIPVGYKDYLDIIKVNVTDDGAYT